MKKRKIKRKEKRRAKNVLNEFDLRCIKKFFFRILPKLEKNTDIQYLGLEGALEGCIKLFEEGKLKLVAENENNFLVLLFPTKKQCVYLYDTNGGGVLNE